VVGKLISSPSDYPRAYICDECVTVCKSIIEDDKPSSSDGGPREANQPFEIQELLHQYLTEVVTQNVRVDCPPGFRRSNDRGAIVLAIRTPDGQTIFNPPGNFEITEKDYLIAMGAVPDLLALDVIKSE
jgi:hypothetical protein